MTPRRRVEPGPTQVESVTDAVRRSILDGIAAPGSPLREEELAHAHGVSRHTVRAALAALAAERLVRAEPYRGVRVAELDDAALDALQEMRAALEVEAIRLARQRGASPATIEAALDELAVAEASGDWIRTLRAHSAVHRTLVDSADSPRIAEAYGALDGEIALLLSHIRPAYPPGSLTAEHRDYVETVLRGPDAPAADAVRAHLAHSAATIRVARNDHLE